MLYATVNGIRCVMYDMTYGIPKHVLPNWLTEGRVILLRDSPSSFLSLRLQCTAVFTIEVLDTAVEGGMFFKGAGNEADSILLLGRPSRTRARD